jgi:hypothetical protein
MINIKFSVRYVPDDLKIYEIVMLEQDGKIMLDVKTPHGNKYIPQTLELTETNLIKLMKGHSSKLWAYYKTSKETQRKIQEILVVYEL